MRFAMRLPAILGTSAPRGRDRLARFGAVGFLFFLVKGLLWLALPVVVYLQQD
jgi:hypothetical protein